MCNGNCKCDKQCSRGNKFFMPIGNIDCLIVTAIIMPDCTIEIDGEVLKEFPQDVQFSGKGIEAKLKYIMFDGTQVGSRPVAWDGGASVEEVTRHVHKTCEANVYDFIQQEGHEIKLEYVL